MHLIAEEGPLRGMIINFDEGEEWVIGRDPSHADFVLEDTMVSRKHLLCTKEPDGIVIKDLSNTNPVLVNDHTIGETYLLHEGDKVQIGQNLFLFSEETPPMIEEPASFSKKIPAAEEKPAHKEPMAQEPEVPEEKLEPAPQEEISAFAPTYDTIYEEKELPFQMLGESPFLLKVVSGPNVGAEYGLDKGKSYLIGKDPNIADIIFNDLSVSKQHAHIEIDEEGTVAISDLGSKNGTFINGKKITQREAISPKDVISLGTSSFLIIDQSAPSETIYSPIPSYETPPSEETVIEEPISWKKQIIPTKYLVMAGSFASILLIVFISFFSLFKSEKVEVVKRDKAQEIKTAIAKYPAVNFSFNPAGDTLFLTGHVITVVDHQELLYDIHQLRFVKNIEDTIIIDELVWKNTNEVLADNPLWRGISLHGTSPGKFVLTGYVKTPPEKEQLDEYMNQHFPYLDKLENKVVVQNLLLQEIGAKILEQGFGAIQYGLMDGELVLSGFYDEKHTEGYTSLKEDLDHLYGVRHIKDLAIASSPQSARIDITKEYQVTGSATYDSKGFGVIINGQILTVGDLLKEMIITEISSNTIYLEKDGAKYKISYSP